MFNVVNILPTLRIYGKKFSLNCNGRHSIAFRANGLNFFRIAVRLSWPHIGPHSKLCIEFQPQGIQYIVFNARVMCYLYHMYNIPLLSSINSKLSQLNNIKSNNALDFENI